MTTEATPQAPPEPRRERRFRRFGLDLALVIGVYLGVSAWQERELLVDETRAPDFALHTLSGERISLESLRGKRVLLHFWATWCGVCRREFGALNAVHAGLASDEALVTIVADGENAAEVRRIVEEEGIAYPVLVGSDAVVDAYRVNVFPTNYFLDADGRIRDQTVGMSTRWGLSGRLRWAAR